MKILVVDDDRVVADLVVFTVRRAGYEAVMASDFLNEVDLAGDVDAAGRRRDRPALRCGGHLKAKTYENPQDLLVGDRDAQ